MKINNLIRTFFFATMIFCVAIHSIASQTPQEASECAQEMVAHYIGNVAPANVSCALNMAFYLRSFREFPDAAELRNGLTTSFTSCYGALPNANALVNRLISNLNEINDVNSTTFGGSSCLKDMWSKIDAILAEANESANANPRPRTNTSVAQESMDNILRNYTNQTGGSSGDPHIVTLDGFRYSFQAEGVFTALITSTKNLEIQVLQKKLPTVQASQNEALAIRYGKTVINLAVVVPTVFVNGKPIPQVFPAKLSDGLEIIQPQPNQFLIKTPTGHFIAVRFRRNLLDYFVKLSPGKIGTIAGGILGNYDFDKKNDLTTRDGKVVKVNDLGKREMLYQVFGDSWRIEPSKSLFVSEILSRYPKFDNTFPAKLVDRMTFTSALKRRATLICQRKGVTDEAILEDCIHDLVLTNNAEFADSAEFAQKVKQNPNQFFRGSQPASGPGFRGTYTFDYTFSDGIKESTKEFQVAVGNDKSAIRYKLKNGVSSRFIINHVEKHFLNVTEFENNSIPSIATKRPFQQDMLREQSTETIRTDITKSIAGVLCRKYVYQGRSVTGEMWVAESLKQTQLIPIEYLIGLADRGFVFTATFPKFLSQNREGMVLEANITERNAKVTFRVKSISTNVDESFFNLNGVRIVSR